MAGWREAYERLSEFDRVSPLEPPQLLELDMAAYLILTDIDRREWGLRWNQALETGGVLVANRVTIEVEAQAAERAQAGPQTAAAVASQSSVQGGADRRALDN